MINCKEGCNHIEHVRKYVVELDDFKLQELNGEKSPSKQLADALISKESAIKEKFFKRTVFECIIDDALECEGYSKASITRIRKSADKLRGPNRKKRLCKKSDILDCWINRDMNLIPDAFQIDKINKTIVCYEIEDWNRLAPAKLYDYSHAWWTLEYIYWDLVLICYDVLGNWKIVDIFQSHWNAQVYKRIQKIRSERRRQQIQDIESFFEDDRIKSLLRREEELKREFEG